MFLFPKRVICVLLLLFFAHVASAQSSPTSADKVEQPGTKDTASTIQSMPNSTKLQIIKMEKASYPIQAAQNGIQGQVWVEMHVSETGDVESVDVLSGDPILAIAAVEASKKWKFKPYIKDGKAIKVKTKWPFDFFFSEKVFDKSLPGTAASDQAKAPPSSGTSLPAANAQASSDPGAPNAPQRVRVSQGVSEGMLIHQIAPTYPPVARMHHIKGTVVLHAVIGTDGRITNLTPISGPKELIPASIGAVEQWRYKPYTLMGRPVEVDTQITINFQMP